MLGYLLAYLKKQYPNVNGVSPPNGNKLSYSELKNSDIALHFEKEATPEEIEGAKKLLAETDLQNVPGAYALKRQKAFDKEMLLGDQLDALSKGLAELLPIILEGAPVTQKTVKMFTPDKDAAPGTPAWWIGTSEDIKARYPKA